MIIIPEINLTRPFSFNKYIVLKESCQSFLMHDDHVLINVSFLRILKKNLPSDNSDGKRFTLFFVCFVRLEFPVSYACKPTTI